MRKNARLSIFASLKIHLTVWWTKKKQYKLPWMVWLIDNVVNVRLVKLIYGISRSNVRGLRDGTHNKKNVSERVTCTAPGVYKEIMQED